MTYSSGGLIQANDYNTFAQGPLSLPIGSKWSYASTGMTGLRSIVWQSTLNRYVIVANTHTISGTARPTLLASDDSFNWYNSTTTTPAQRLNRVVRGSNGTFLALGESGTIIRSTTGTGTWTITTTNGSPVNHYDAVHLGGNNWVSVALSGNPRTSTDDGLNWTLQDVPRLFRSVTYTGSRVVAVGDGGIVFTNDANGVGSYTSRTSGTAQTLSRVLWANNLLIAVGANGTIITSPDGITWTTRTSNTTQTLNDIVFANGGWVVVGNNGVVRTSSNGINWNTSDVPVVYGVTPNLTGVTYNSTNGVMVVITENGDALRSTIADSTSVAEMWGIGTGRYGLGQTTTSLTAVSAGQQATAAQWSGLINATNNLTMHQNNTFFTPNPAVTAGNTITAYNTLYAAIMTAFNTNGTTAIGTNDGSTFAATYNGVWGNWGNRRATFTNKIEFASLEAAKYFFNAGGQIKTTYSRSGGTGTRNASWTSLASECGTVVIGNNATTRVSGSGATPTVLLNSKNGGFWAQKPNEIKRHFTQADDIFGYSNNTIQLFLQTRTAPVAPNFNSIATNGTIYVAVGDLGEIYSSTNGVTWTRRLSTQVTNLNSVIFGNGRFVAVGNNGGICYSNDGLTWNDSRPATLTTDLRSVTYSSSLGGGLYVAVGGIQNSTNGVILTSPDGITWTIRVSNAANQFNGVSVSSSHFLAVGNSGFVQSSTDGITWGAAGASGTTQTLRNVYWTGTTWVVVGDGLGTGVLSTTNLRVYTTANPSSAAVARTSNVTGTLRGIGMLSSTIIVVGDGGICASSTDASTWTSRSLGTINDLTAVAGHSTAACVVSYYGSIYTTSNAINWFGQDSGSTVTMNSIAFNAAGRFVAVGNGGRIYTTDDYGTTWIQRTSPVTSALYEVIYGLGRFIAVGDQGVVLTSTDGISWTSQTTGISTALYGVAAGTTTFVAVGIGGVIISSSNNGVSWTSRPSGTTNNLFNVAFSATAGTPVFLAVGAGGVARSSTEANVNNGTIWTTRTSGMGNIYCVRWDATFGAFVVVGDGSTNLRTVTGDGGTWTSRTAGSGTYRSISRCGDRVIIVGENGIIWGATAIGSWTQLSTATNTSFPSNDNLLGIAGGDVEHIIVGDNNTCKLSTTGQVWDDSVIVRLNDTQGVPGYILYIYSVWNNNYVASPETVDNGTTNVVISSPSTTYISNSWGSPTAGPRAARAS